jgi:enediyne biosynthesis protein E4
MTRRALLASLFPALASAQMASRGVKPTPAGKRSGRPFSRFTDVAHEAGLRAPVVYGNPGHTDYALEAMGCGCGFLDFDNDGWLDVLLLTGRRFDATPEGATLRLYKNNRDGTFTDVTAHSGLGLSMWAAGVTIGDFDNDGFDDVFLTGWPRNYLFRNRGDGTFADITEKAGLQRDGMHYATGATWVDYDRDGRLDLFVSHYLAFDPATTPARGKDPNCKYLNTPVFCGPAGRPQEACRLYRNNGDGTFTDVSEKSGISRVKAGYALTAVATDLDGDGWPDIYVACDTSPSLLFRNQHDGTFKEQGLEAGVSLSEDGQEQAGMGIAAGDYDADGNLDLFKTHFRGDTNVLYRGNGKGAFRDTTIRAGLGVETRYVDWGAGIVDLDNDGLADLFFTTGMVYPDVREAPYRTPSVVFRNLGEGKFEELDDVGGLHSARGVAFGDFDNDGDLDILIVNLNEPPTLLRNDAPAGRHWLKVLLVGTESNRSAIGAQVVATYGARRQAQAVLAQSSYLSVNDRRLHFGLGAETKATLEVRWPSGKVEAVGEVAADRLITIREGSGVVAQTELKAARPPGAAPGRR